MIAEGPRRRRLWRILLVLLTVLVATGGAAYRYGFETPKPAARSAARAVPVTLALAGRRDVPIYATGLGTVQAFVTVAIHAQVDGKLQEVLFTEGQRVKQGDVLAKIDPRLFQAALDQAMAKKAQDQAQLIAAEKDLVRSKTLAQKDFGSQQQVDLNQAKVDQFKASIAADVAAIDTAQTQLDYTSITAPSDGRVGIRLVDPGNIVHASDQRGIVNVVLMQPSAVIFTLPSMLLPDVRAALARDAVEVVAFDQKNRQALATGKLLLVDNAIDQATATIRLKALFPNEDERLWPGDFVNARLLLETRANAIAVPTAAVQRGPQGMFTWVVTERNTAEPRPIEVGPTTDGVTIITAGLSEGERVITDGQYKVRRGATVSAASPQAADAGSGK